MLCEIYRGTPVLFLAYLNQIVRDSVSVDGKFHAHPMYIFLNLVVPLILGMFLAGSIKVVNWMLTRQAKRSS